MSCGAGETGEPFFGMRTDGTRFSGALVDLVAGRQVVFRRGDKSVQVPWDQLVVWGAYRDRYQGTQLLLADGSRLVAELLRIEAGRVTVAGRTWAETAIPISAIRAVVMQLPAGCLERDLLCERLQAMQPAQDRLVLGNGDQLDGQLVTPVRLEAGEFNPTTIQWRMEDGGAAVPIRLDRVVAIVPRHANGMARSSSRAGIVVGWRDGSRLYANQVTRQGGALDVQLGGAVRLKTEPTAGGENPWHDVVFIQPMNTQVVYL